MHIFSDMLLDVQINFLFFKKSSIFIFFFKKNLFIKMQVAQQVPSIFELSFEF